MAPNLISDLLRGLGSADAEAAWGTFLAQYSSVLQQVIVLSVDGADARADCFVFVCEQLAEKRFRRLRKFDCSGTASFATWLRAVARNLCVDWRRKNCGRFQPFEWTKSLEALDRQVFRCVQEQGCSIEHTFACLAPVVPGLTVAMVEESAARIGAKLSPRERWLLSTRQVRMESLDASEEQGGTAREVPDRGPDPERAAMDAEYQRALASNLQTLPAADRLLLHLRFEQELTLAEIARLCGLKDAQTADRRVRSVLEELRGRLTGFSPRVPGKAKPASV